jgi:hypothetical protein
MDNHNYFSNHMQYGNNFLKVLLVINYLSLNNFFMPHNSYKLICCKKSNIKTPNTSCFEST